MHDSDELAVIDFNTYHQFDVTIESWDQERDALKTLVRKELCPLIQKTLLANFTKDLVECMFFMTKTKKHTPRMYTFPRKP